MEKLWISQILAMRKRKIGLEKVAEKLCATLRDGQQKKPPLGLFLMFRRLVFLKGRFFAPF